jgi:hypothetical protein
MPARKEFQLMMENVEPGQYTIGLEIREQFFNEHRFTLIDHYLDQMVPMKRGDRYEFTITTDSNAKAATRFSILVEEDAGDDVVASVQAYPNPVQDKLQINIMKDDVYKIEFVNALGQVHSSIAVNENVKSYSVDFGSYKKGMYLMVVSRRSGKKSIRLFKE